MRKADEGVRQLKEIDVPTYLCTDGGGLIWHSSGVEKVAIVSHKYRVP